MRIRKPFKPQSVGRLASVGLLVGVGDLVGDPCGFAFLSPTPKDWQIPRDLRRRILPSAGRRAKESFHPPPRSAPQSPADRATRLSSQSPKAKSLRPQTPATQSTANESPGFRSRSLTSLRQMLARKFGRLVVLREFQNLSLHAITESRPAFNQSSQLNVINLIQSPTRVGPRVALKRTLSFFGEIVTVSIPPASTIRPLTKIS